MAYGAAMENIMELAKQGGSLGSQNVYSIMQALNQDKLATKRYKEAFGLEQEKYGESKRQWQSDFDRQKELDKLEEELSRAKLALDQAASGRADVTSEMNRIGSFYPAATTEARSGTRQDLINRGLIPASLQEETMFDINRPPATTYPAAQVGLYSQQPSLLNYGQTNQPNTRIVNAPPGTQVNPMQNSMMLLAQLKELMNMGRGSNPAPTITPSRTSSVPTGTTQPSYAGINLNPGKVWTATGGLKTLKQYGY